MKKNPFKKKNLTDTLINTAIGGAGNVVFDTIWGYLPASVTEMENADTIKNAIKLVGGAVAGSMVNNRYLRAMTDGFAVVGASDLVSGLVGDALQSSSSSSGSEGSEGSEGSAGLPQGTIGRIRRPMMHYGTRRRSPVRGTHGLEGFME